MLGDGPANNWVPRSTKFKLIAKIKTILGLCDAMRVPHWAEPFSGLCQRSRHRTLADISQGILPHENISPTAFRWKSRQLLRMNFTLRGGTAGESRQMCKPRGFCFSRSVKIPVRSHCLHAIEIGVVEELDSFRRGLYGPQLAVPVLALKLDQR
jgi:hypothetical protein